MVSARKRLLRFYWRMEQILAPGLRNSQYLYLEMLDRHVSPDTLWLDLGCGHQIVPDWMQPESRALQDAIVERSRMLTGIDMDAPSLSKNALVKCRVLGDISDLPFEDEAFNLVTANMVLEHVSDPRAVLHGVCRVMRPGGLFIFHTPNRLHYATLLSSCVPAGIKNRAIRFLEGRDEEDVFRTYYRVNTAKAIAQLAKKCGFEPVEISMVESSAQTIMLGPMAVFELLVIRALRSEALRNYRDSIIAVLRKAG